MSETRATPLLERDLGPADFEVLEFERATWKYAGVREATVLARFGTSLTRHLQKVLALVDHPQAVVYDPQLVNRIRARRDRLKTQRPTLPPEGRR